LLRIALVNASVFTGGPPNASAPRHHLAGDTLAELARKHQVAQARDSHGCKTSWTPKPCARLPMAWHSNLDTVADAASVCRRAAGRNCPTPK